VGSIHVNILLYKNILSSATIGLQNTIPKHHSRHHVCYNTGLSEHLPLEPFWSVTVLAGPSRFSHVQPKGTRSVVQTGKKNCLRTGKAGVRAANKLTERYVAASKLLRVLIQPK
jgi:hypothetical protein